MRLESEAVAEALFRIGAVSSDPAHPFKFSSGLWSPVYVDCRRLISFPRERTLVVDLFQDIVGRLPGPKPDIVAGGETAGIPFAAWVAERLALPLVYVRKKPKEFGRLARVEGVVSDGQQALLVEDLITNAGSKLSFQEGLLEAGAQVHNVLVIFEYGVPGTRRVLGEHSMTLSSLVSGSALLEHGKRNGLLTPSQAKEIDSFIAHPVEWSRAHSDAAEAQ